MKAPWRLWAVGVVALLVHGLGALDYTMTQVQGDAWLAHMEPTPAQLAWFHATPAWAEAAWALGVWGGLAGAILLLIRRRLALHAFAISFLGWAAGTVHAFALSNGLEVMGGWWPMQLVHGAVGAFLIWYAWAMGKRGVLR